MQAPEPQGDVWNAVGSWDMGDVGGSVGPRGMCGNPVGRWVIGDVALTLSWGPGSSQHRRCHMAWMCAVSLWFPYGENSKEASRREMIGKSGGKGQLLEVS